MEESKNMSEAYRVYASLSTGSQLDKTGAELLGKKIGNERWSRM